jgi:hypothetical protein
LPSSLAPFPSLLAAHATQQAPRGVLRAHAASRGAELARSCCCGAAAARRSSTAPPPVPAPRAQLPFALDTSARTARAAGAAGAPQRAEEQRLTSMAEEHIVEAQACGGAAALEEPRSLARTTATCRERQRGCTSAANQLLAGDVPRTQVVQQPWRARDSCAPYGAALHAQAAL